MKESFGKSPLAIALIGVGRIGSTFAYQLAAAGHEVTLIARPGSARLGQLQRDHGIVLETGARVQTLVTDRLDEQKVYDLVIVTLLAEHVDAILPALTRSKAKCIHFMFVSFEPELLLNAIGKTRCSFGMPFITATLDGDGKLRPAIGSRNTIHSEQRWVDLFNLAGVPSALETRMTLWLRCHTPIAIMLENIAFAGQRHNGGATWAEAKIVSLGLKGCYAIIKGLGYDIYPSSKGFFNSLPLFILTLILWLGSRVKPFRELLSQGIGEARALTDIVLAAAAKAELQTPEAIKAVSNTKEIQY
ncbi:MAG: 2-dehydropantoate 2-reductase N-terminal domain-containing protein [Bacteroidota bacterium]